MGRVLPNDFTASSRPGCVCRLFKSPSRGLAVLFLCVLASGAAAAAFSERQFSPRRGDIVAFIRSADGGAQNDAGHLESLLSLRVPGASFRNLAWEGYTVCAQTRDIGFPSLVASLE